MKHLLKIGLCAAAIFTILALPTAVERCFSTKSFHLPILQYSNATTVCPMENGGMTLLLAHIGAIKGVLAAIIIAGAVFIVVSAHVWQWFHFLRYGSKHTILVSGECLYTHHPLGRFMMRRTFSPKAP